MISGPPLSPTARVDLTCPGLTMDGKILRNIFLHARLDNLKDESSDIALTGGLEAGLSLRGESIDLKTDWDIRRGRTGTLDAALRNASMRGGGSRRTVDSLSGWRKERPRVWTEDYWPKCRTGNTSPL